MLLVLSGCGLDTIPSDTQSITRCIDGDTDYVFEGDICRKKTINDYKCEELLEHILLKDVYCTATNEFSLEEQTICALYHEELSTEELKEIAIHKGCYITDKESCPEGYYKVSTMCECEDLDNCPECEGFVPEMECVKK